MKKLKKLLYRVFLGNPVSIRMRQIACRWRCVRRDGVVVWYKAVRQYPGYGPFDYEKMFSRVAATVRKYPRKYPGKRAVADMEVWYSGGRTAVGTRKVSYVIRPYRDVF